MVAVPKDRTIEALREEWASIADLLGALSDDDWSRPTPLPGWDVKDNVAHIIATEKMLSGEEAPAIEIDRTVATHVTGDASAFNEAWVESMRPMSSTTLTELFSTTAVARLAALESMSQDEWDTEGFTPAGRATAGRFIQIRVFDCWFHEQDIRDAVGRPGNESGLPVEVTLDELTTAMGFVVGKKAGAEPGQAVTFRLTDRGSVVREIHVEVGERAAVVDQLIDAPTATLTMPVGVMTRRSGGRIGADDLIDQIHIAGDTDLARRVIAAQNYTI